MRRTCSLHQASRSTSCRYVRLELLEGVAAWYAGDRSLARERLQAARAKWAQLQVSDDALASLANMGFRTAEVGACAVTDVIAHFEAGQQSDMG